MTRTLRPVVLILVALHLAACSSWRAQVGDVRDALTDPEVEHVRLTRTNGQRVEVRMVEIQGDSIYGTLGGSGPVTCTEASTFCNARIPISQVGFVETRSFSAVRTASLFVVPLAVLAVVFVVDDRCSPLDGPC